MKKKKETKVVNFVAKYSRNKTGAGAHRDETKYTRKEKHKGSDKGLYYYLLGHNASLLNEHNIQYVN